MSREVEKELVAGTSLFFYPVELSLYIVECRPTILRLVGDLDVGRGRRRSEDAGIIKLEPASEELFDYLDVINTPMEVLQRDMFAFVLSP